MRALLFLLALTASFAACAETSTVTVEVDAAAVGDTLRDLNGVNKKPTFSTQPAGVNVNGASLYSAFGVSQARLHDSGIDLCTTYTAAIKLNVGVSPAQTVSGCTLTPNGGLPHFMWTPASSADADLNNPNNYNFTFVDEALASAISTGAAVYLRLGDNFNGPNDTADPVAWAKVAANIYKHVIGVFKPTAGIAVNPAYVEVFNEPDGGAWQGETPIFDTLFVETVQRVRAAAAAAGKTVVIGGPGFTKNILRSSAEAGSPANGFIAAVGASTIDFFSAHLYDACAGATLASSANFLRSLRTVVNNQGGSAKPLHISEWNIGLGSQCGNDLYAEQRLQSFTSGVLTLMRDPAQKIEAAHFYAALPIMALFDFVTAAGTARINPSAWAFWAHSRLRGAKAVDAKVCPQSASCIAGYAAESAQVLAVAGQTSGGQNIVVTNDGGAAVTYTLRVKGLTSSAVDVTINTPPAGARDLPASGNPITADPTALAALMTSIAKDTRAALAVSSGKVEPVITIPAHSLQLIEVRPAPSSSASLPNYSDSWWNANESGWGVTITDHGSNAFVQWYTYDQNGHNQKFVISGGSFANDKCQFSGVIMHVTGPSWTAPTFDPGLVAMTTAGYATIDFCPPGLPAGTIVFNYTADGVSGSKQLTRLAFGNDVPHWGGNANTGATDFTDLWYNPSESGWGVSITQHGDNIFFRIFVYDTDGRPLLFVIPGVTFASATSFAGALQLTSGPWFGTNPFDPSAVVRNTAGSATLSFADAYNGSLSYTVNGVTKTKSITRIQF